MDKFRIYKDTQGVTRKLRFVREKPYLVKAFKDLGASTATEWESEDGSLIQIPENAWCTLLIEYIDVYE